MTNPAQPDVDALKPCPFCGSAPKCNGFPSGTMGQIYCDGTECFGPRTTALTKQDSIIQWNTRATPVSSEAAEGAAAKKADYLASVIAALKTIEHQDVDFLLQHPGWVNDPHSIALSFRNQIINAAVGEMFSLLFPPCAGAVEPVAWTDNQIYFAARALALTNPYVYEDKSHKGSLRPNQRALDAALMALGAAVRYDSAVPLVRGDREIVRRAFAQHIRLVPVDHTTFDKYADEASFAGASLSWMIKSESIEAFLDAILSLPVQSNTTNALEELIFPENSFLRDSPTNHD